MEFGVLGPLRVSELGREVEIRRGISRRLLTAFVLRVRETIPSSSLMDLLWGDDQPQNPANALQIQVSHLRRTLAAESGGQPIATRPGGYCLDVDPGNIDAVVFERLLDEVSLPDQQATGAQLDDALARVEQALALWRGEALVEIGGEPFAQGAVTRLDEMRSTACELRCDLLLALGRPQKAVELARSAIADQPLRERPYEQLMVALYRSGRQADSLAVYHSARATLVEELGLDPGPVLQKLQRDILEQDPSLDWRPPTPTGSAGSMPGLGRIEPAASIPIPVTRLIGRDDAVVRLVAHVDRNRLVTLTGPGGAGKTRLAIEVAERAAAQRPVWFVELGAIDRIDLVSPTVAGALGASGDSTDDPVDLLAEVMRGERGLLVLDTCEHVLQGAASLVSSLLRRLPNIRVLVTSRRALGIAGEAVWPVPPLDVAPSGAATPAAIAGYASVQLFCERAQALRPDFELDASNAAAVAGICADLDGLPLAIELAASRTDIMSPTFIRDRLQNRFDLLVEGAADAAERQQTLRATIDWSSSLLSEEQRQCFARLGVFPGSFDLDAAGVVAGAEPHEALDLLSGLVRHSMIITEDGDRFRLLDSLRAYASELLGADAHDVHHRHAAHYADVAERLERKVRTIGQTQALALDRLRADGPNFRAASEWAIAAGELPIATRLAGALALFWTIDGRFGVTNAELRRAVEDDDASPVARAKVLWGHALLVAGRGELDEAKRAADASVRLARESGNGAVIGAALNALGVALWALGDSEASIAAHDEAIERFVEAHDIWGESVCRVLRARTAIDRGDDDAEQLLVAAMATARRCGGAHVVGLGLGLQAELHASRGCLAEAIESARESLSTHESIDYAEGVITALHVLSRLQIETGDHAGARQTLERGLRMAWLMQHAAATCEALEGLAVLACREGDLAIASDLLGAASYERAERNLSIRPQDQAMLNELSDEIRESGRATMSRVALADVVGAALG